MKYTRADRHGTVLAVYCIPDGTCTQIETNACVVQKYAETVSAAGERPGLLCREENEHLKHVCTDEARGDAGTL